MGFDLARRLDAGAGAPPQFPPRAFAGGIVLEAGRPSVTAQGAAIQRAAHQLLEAPRVFDDPLALAMIGTEAEATLRADLAAYQTPYRRRQRANIAARSRHAEDALAKAQQQGVRQYVLLGAGLDSFAYRPGTEDSGLRVFEVDYPATQAWKRGRLAERALSPRRALTYVPIDFERQRLEDALRDAGLALDEPAFFSWLGVTTYLTTDAVFQTLRSIAALAPGTSIVFTYGQPPETLNPEQRAMFDAVAERVAELGEPWRSFFDPAELARDLRAIGFSGVEDLGPAEINARYFAARSDGFAPGPTGHLALATV
jgi:methyltransferase (TIGR00027 family)